MLIGKLLTLENLKLAADEALSQAQPHRFNEFKVDMAKRGIVRASPVGSCVPFIHRDTVAEETPNRSAKAAWVRWCFRSNRAILAGHSSLALK